MRVRIEAPSSPFPNERLEAGKARLEKAGIVVDTSHAAQRGHHAYLNGSDDERRSSLEAALRDPQVDVVWLARGGYGLTRIVGRLDVPARTPIVCGFSDATALFAHLSGTGVRCVHGPLATTIAYEPDETFEHCLAVLRRDARGRKIPVALSDPDVDVDVDGFLFAANLCVLAHLCGTPSMPNLDGAVLVLEEVGERPYRIDRMLTQLKESGALAGVRAVIVGHLSGCVEPVSPGSTRDPAPAALEVFRERLRSLEVPIGSGIAVGHEPPNFALPLGGRVRFTGARSAGGTLELLEDLPP